MPSFHRSPSPAASEASFSGSIYNLQGLYVPVHRRTYASSSRSISPADSERTPAPAHPFIYSREALLNIARSPLSRLDSEKREEMRAVVPELVMNRKMRKSIEYHAQQLQRAQSPPKSQSHSQTRSSSPPAPAKPTPPKQQVVIASQPLQQSRIANTTPQRRSRPTGRKPERRARNGIKVLEETNWRVTRTSLPTPLPVVPISV